MQSCKKIPSDRIVLKFTSYSGFILQSKGTNERGSGKSEAEE